MQEIATTGVKTTKSIHLFHTTREVDAVALDNLVDEALAANIHFHILIDERDGKLTSQRIIEDVPGWREARCACTQKIPSRAFLNAISCLY